MKSHFLLTFFENLRLEHLQGRGNLQGKMGEKRKICLERRVFADGEIECIGIQVLADALKSQCPSTFTW